ncbi:MAG TPA: tRNA epoxyqueuosine(34) reductase QueG [Pyrinomonadaceae bacterium]|nr:tRNA epoxyqueuosine(34) reductase QueG [Pyrinomonadaceae bacterium]
MTTDRTTLTKVLKVRARDLGFDKVGIVPAEALNEERARLEEWLGRGYHGEMPYLARDPEQRTNPRKLFPDARSVVVVALNYYTPHQHSVRIPPRRDSDRIQRASGSNAESLNHPRVSTGKVSRYAWGDDYHDVVADKLRSLLSWIKEEFPKADGKICVDIQPAMDKAWAVRAGLGWMGKHTNVITPEFGSWVFIGELLLNLELDYDAQEIADQCGSCTLCIDACPTSAIVAPYLLDANLCISHATIESRAAEIRDDVAANLEGWLYGCDICQDVCPWNHTPTVTTEDRFQPREANVDVALNEILELGPETYAERFRGSAMKRAKLPGLQRNAGALLANS